MIEALFRKQTDNSFVQLVRYTMVGGIAFIVDFTALYLLTEIANIYYLISAAIAFLLGLATNYSLSIVWVFNKRAIKNKSLEFGLFMLIGVVGLGLNQIFLWSFTEYAGLHYLTAKIVATVFIYLWNFLARKFILFN